MLCLWRVCIGYGPLKESESSTEAYPNNIDSKHTRSKTVLPSAVGKGGLFQENFVGCSPTNTSSLQPLSCSRCQERQDKNQANRHINHFAMQLRKEPWYLGRATREEALQILAKKDIGSFIVRDSSSHIGCFALSVKVPRFDNPSGIAHYLIEPSVHGGVRLKGLDKEWPSVGSLVLHHSFMPEMMSCVLKMPSDERSSKAKETPSKFSRTASFEHLKILNTDKSMASKLSPSNRSDQVDIQCGYQRLVDCS